MEIKMDKVMLIDVEVLTVRLNGKIIQATPISDIYNREQITLDSKYLTDEDINKYYIHISPKYKQAKFDAVRQSGSLRDEQEAKDLCCELSQYKINIEHYDLEIPETL